MGDPNLEYKNEILMFAVLQIKGVMHY